MKRLLITLLVAALLLAGCTTEAPVLPDPEQTSSSTADPASPAPTLTDAQRDRYTQALNELNSRYALYTNWNGSPLSAPEGFQVYCGFDLVEVSPIEDGKVAVTVELYAELSLDPNTMTDSLYPAEIVIHSEGLPHSPAIAFGKSVVELGDSGIGIAEPLSCSYYPYNQPGIAYLKEQATKNPPADSPKLDSKQYDPAFLNFVWKKLLPTRYIASPANITHADLAAMTGYLEIDWSMLPPDADVANYYMDSSLLRLMPNLTHINCYIFLNDYSVFEGMNKLETLSLSNMNDARMATLKVGHTDKLHLETPDCDMLDLTNVNTETLSMTSWSTAVRGFAGCDRIKSLYIHSTRTDMRLVNAESFPSIEYLNLQFYSDFERVRDFSQLATFPDTVTIDLWLSYMACNDKTVETLAGLPIRLLVLSPTNGAGNRTVNPELVAAIPCKTLHQGEYIDPFDVYTKDSYVG